MAKFQQNWMKIVDFLVIANFEACPSFFYSVLISDQRYLTNATLKPKYILKQAFLFPFFKIKPEYHGFIVITVVALVSS